MTEFRVSVAVRTLEGTLNLSPADALAMVDFGLLFVLFVFSLGAVTETDWIEVFKAGDYPQGEFSESDVEALADKYDSDDLFEAPVSTDHRQEGPAFGWVSDLKAEAGRLFAKLRKVPEQFAEAINQESFKNRSIEIFPDMGGEGMYLKAVSFLGVKPPQIKDLSAPGTIEFSDEQLVEESVAIAFSDEDDEGDEAEEDDDEEEEAGEASDEGEGEEAEESEGDEDDAEGDEDGEDGEVDEDEFSDVSTFAELKQEVSRLQTQLQEETEARKEAEAKASGDDRQELKAFMEENIPPSVRDRVEVLFEALQSDHIEFAHGRDDVEDDPIECFRSLLDEMSHSVLFEEQADEDGDDEPQFATFNDLTEAVREEMAEQGQI